MFYWECTVYWCSSGTVFFFLSSSESWSRETEDMRWWSNGGKNLHGLLKLETLECYCVSEQLTLEE